MWVEGAVDHAGLIDDAFYKDIDFVIPVEKEVPVQ